MRLEATVRWVGDTAVVIFFGGFDVRLRVAEKILEAMTLATKGGRPFAPPCWIDLSDCPAVCYS